MKPFEQLSEKEQEFYTDMAFRALQKLGRFPIIDQPIEDIAGVAGMELVESAAQELYYGDR